MALNNVSLNGRLTKDPDLRYTPGGTAVATFTLAVARDYKNENGDNEADFIQCVIWKEKAETLANHVEKGHMIGVQGRLQTRSYENNDGFTVWVTEVNVNNFYFLESKKEEQPQNNNGSGNRNNNRNQNNKNGNNRQRYGK